QQRTAHESPVYFYSLLLGSMGPVLLITVPPIRRRMGIVKPEEPPRTFPLPKRPRRPTVGFEDPEPSGGSS
ncbi:hypothetical protein CALVIDRAFT_488242, partial [Calocera viscosa TUFC12733]